jgi:ATP-binding protein involved in chromosome partitioning
MVQKREPDSEVPREVLAALADAEVGRDVLFDDLVGIDGVGDVTHAGGTVTVPVTLPTPAESIRERIEQEIRAAASGVPGVDETDVVWEPRAADPGERVEFIPEVRNVVAVASGKGGVGKSTLATNLAVALADAGADVGLLDADVYGPNAPALLGLGDSKPTATGDDMMVPREAFGVKAMSMGFIVEEDDPVIWRGPLVDDFVKQLFDDVAWGDLDYLIVDMPPGTGDAQLSLVQHLPVTGAVIVTTPQGVAVDDARRGLKGFARYQVPVLGVAENMSGFQCPDCGSAHDIFDAGGARQLAAEFEIPLLGKVPIDPAVGTLSTDGEADEPPGVNIPGFGRLQLPRTREERERPDTLDPMVVRDDADETRTALRELATRTAARVNALAASEHFEAE